MKQQKKKLIKMYARIGRDKYELIEAIADSPKELAAICHTTVNVVLSSISHHKGTYERIEFEDN